MRLNRTQRLEYKKLVYDKMMRMRTGRFMLYLAVIMEEGVHFVCTQTKAQYTEVPPEDVTGEHP